MSNNFTDNGETENRQSRGNLADIAWLAGIVDGEGCLRAKFNSHDRTIPTIWLELRIGNTSMSLLEKCQRIIQDLCHKKHNLNKHCRTENLHVMWSIEVTKQNYLLTVIEAILPHLTSKRAQAEAMLVYLRSRKNRKHYHQPYTQEELGLVDALKFLKRSELVKVPGAVEIECETPEVAVC